MQRIKILWMEVAFHACYIFLAIYALFRVYSLGPNPYEQGIMYTAAIAAREGLEPNRDFFMQYGPVSSWLQGYWMRLFGPELIQLQLSTMFAVLLLSSVTFFTLRIFLGNTLAIYLSALWLMSGPHGAPWSSLWSNLFAICGGCVIYYCKTNYRVFKTFRTFSYLFIANSFLVLGFFTRIHVIVVIFLITFLIFFDASTSREFKKIFFFTQFCVSVIFTLSLALMGVLRPWFEQCIIWTAKTYVGKGPGFTLARVGDALFIVIIPLLVGLLFLLLHLIFVRHAGKRSLPSIASRIVILIFTLVSLIFIFKYQFFERTYPYTLVNPQVLMVTFSEKFFFFFTFAILSIFILLSILRLYFWFSKKEGSVSVFDCLAVGLLTQLYPLHDAFHIFVIVPGLLISIAYYYKKEISSFYNYSIRNQNFIKNMIGKGLLVVLLLQNLLLGLKVDYHFSSSILSGIASRSYSSYVQEGRMTEQWAKQLDATITALSRYPVRGNVHFYCKDGLFSSANGTYLPADQYYVNWGPIPKDRAVVKYSFYCALTKDELYERIESGSLPIFVKTFPASPMSKIGELYYALLERK